MCNWNANTSENIAKYKELVSPLYQTYDLIIISQIQDLTKKYRTNRYVYISKVHKSRSSK